MGAFSFSGGEPDPVNLGLVNNADSSASKNFSELVIADPLFNVTLGKEDELKEQLILAEPKNIPRIIR